MLPVFFCLAALWPARCRNIAEFNSIGKRPSETAHINKDCSPLSPSSVSCLPAALERVLIWVFTEFCAAASHWLRTQWARATAGIEADVPLIMSTLLSHGEQYVIKGLRLGPRYSPRVRACVHNAFTAQWQADSDHDKVSPDQNQEFSGGPKHSNRLNVI